MVRQDKNKGGRVTPKGTVSTPSEFDEVTGGSRVQVKGDGGSPLIVPVVMFGSMVLGAAIILFNYLTEDILGTPNNWYLFGGLGLVLVGIIAATQYR